MNIFFLDSRASVAARLHCDAHVVKMLLETVQLLYGVWHFYGTAFDDGYKWTHKQHPVAVWCRSCRAHYMWTVELAAALLVEYEKRYNKQHKCGVHVDRFVQLGSPSFLPKENTNPPTNAVKFGTTHAPEGCDWAPLCMPVELIIKNSVVASYQNYYGHKKEVFKKPFTHCKHAYDLTMLPLLGVCKRVRDSSEKDDTTVLKRNKF